MLEKWVILEIQDLVNKNMAICNTVEQDMFRQTQACSVLLCFSMKSKKGKVKVNQKMWEIKSISKGISIISLRGVNKLQKH